MNHFEDLWNEAELLSSRLNDNRQVIDIIKSINQNLKNLAFIDDEDEKKNNFGSILFELCILSRVMNINSYASLNSILFYLKNKIKEQHSADEEEDD